MDLRSPLRSIAPGLDAGVLTALAGTEGPLSATAISRLAGYGTRNGQAPVLDRLVRHGLVLADPGNLGSLYRLNRDHVLAPAVLAAVAARTDLIARLRDGVARLAPELVHASLFGSFARHEAGPDSDIDLLLVTVDEPAEDMPDRVVALAADVRRWCGNDLHTVSLTRSHLARATRGEAVVDAWLRDGVAVHGPDLAVVIGSTIDG